MAHRRTKLTAEAALDRAQDLAFDAMDAHDPRERRRLAMEAVAVSPLCADGFGVLAGDEPQPAKALGLWRQAVAAGEAALGERAFIDDAGHFWGILETRPYMRAKSGLAAAAWRAGERDEAIGHARDMLRLCPNDNLGMRYGLAVWLLTAGRDGELSPLFETYDEDSGHWLWAKALAAFRAGGEGPEADRALKAAMAENPHAPAFLTGRRRLPKAMPDRYSPGDADEAVIIAAEAKPAWTASPGALDWLRRSARPPGRGAAKAQEPEAEAALRPEPEPQAPPEAGRDAEPAGLSPAAVALDAFLESLPLEHDAMMLSDFDGLVAGVLACPEPIAPAEWLPLAWGPENETLPTDDPERVRRGTGLMLDYYNEAAEDLAAGVWTPVFLVDDRDEVALWELWAEGFGAALDLRPLPWAALEKADPEAGSWLLALRSLVGIARGESKLGKAATDQLTAVGPEVIECCVPALHARRTTRSTPRTAPRTGRNDACPCGSGRKYKKCCGAN